MLIIIRKKECKSIKIPRKRKCLIEFYFPGGKNTHLQQQETMAETADIGASIGSFLVTDRDLHNLQIQLVGSENEVEISKRVEIPEEFPVGDETVVIFPEDNLGAA